MEKRMPK